LVTTLSNKENNLQGKKYYAWIIYKLQRELGIRAIPLGEVKMLALQFYANNAQPFKSEVKGEEILKTMMERAYMPDKPIKTKSDMLKK
jgi:hypothetical protein